MTATPQSIKEAAEKYARSENGGSPGSGIIQSSFIAGATHEETERYYENKHNMEMIGLVSWMAISRIKFSRRENKFFFETPSMETEHFYTEIEIIQLYKSETIKTK